MRDLLMSECRRYRRTALLAYLIHLALLLFISRTINLLALPATIQLLLAAL